MFEVIDSNKRRTIVIVGLFLVFLFAVILAVGYVYQMDLYFLVPMAAILSVITSVGSYYYSDSIVLSISRAVPADDIQFRHVYDILQGVCIAAGISKVPRLYIIYDTAPNAFATGRNPEHSVICVTSGILDKLSDYELEGVLAHELAHIKNYDILLGTVVTVLVGMSTLLADWFTRGMFRGRRGRDNGRGRGSNPILLIIGIVLILLAPMIAQIMKLALSRNREYLADATAIEFTRNPQGLIDALSKISQDREPLEQANKATANLYIVNPLKGEEAASWLEKLYSTHPPIEERITALKNIH